MQETKETGDFSCCGPRALGNTGLSSCGPWALLPHGMWNLPRPTYGTHVPCTGRQILNLGTAREAQQSSLVSSVGHRQLTQYSRFSSVAQSSPTLCDPMNHSISGFPVHHQLPEFTQTHVHPAGDAIHSSHPLCSPSPPGPNPSQRQGLFQ